MPGIILSQCCSQIWDSSLTQELVQVHILKPQPRSTESKALGWGPALCALTSLPDVSDAHFRFRAMFWALSGHQLSQTFQKLNEIGTFIVNILQMENGGTKKLNNLPLL